MDPLGIIGFVVSLGIAWWQYRRARRAEATNESLLKKVPEQVIGGIRKVLSSQPSNEAGAGELGGRPNIVSYADVNGDGASELLVQYPAGAHGSALKVFGWEDFELKEIGDLRVGTPVGFEVGDFDGDGRIEIATEETDWEAGQPYVSAPRLRLLFRWDGEKFVEVSRQPSE